MKNTFKLFAVLAAAVVLSISALASQSSWIEVAASNTRLERRYNFSSLSDCVPSGAQVGSVGEYRIEWIPAVSSTNTKLVERTVVFTGTSLPRYLQEFFQTYTPYTPEGGVQGIDICTDEIWGHYTSPTAFVLSHRIFTYKRGTSTLYTITQTLAQNPNLPSLYDSLRPSTVGVFSKKSKSANLIPGAPETDQTWFSESQSETIGVWRATSYPFHVAAFGANWGYGTPNAGNGVAMQICDLGTYSAGSGWISNLLVFSPPAGWPSGCPSQLSYEFPNYVIKQEMPQ